MSQSFNTKLGTTRAGERTRVWLEGDRLLVAGFTRGATVKRAWGDGRLVLTVITPAAAADLERHERGSVAGTNERPIIDITGARVASTFKGEQVAVTFSAGRIVISNT
jgi:hypothetical protein